MSHISIREEEGSLAHQQVCSSLFRDSHLNLKQMEVSEHMSEQSTETCLTTNKHTLYCI